MSYPLSFSFNTREFLHGRTREAVRAVRWALLLLVFPVPAVILGISGDNPFLLAVAFALQYAGVRAVRVHALHEKARQFYEHYGFQPSPTHPMTLMLRLGSVKA